MMSCMILKKKREKSVMGSLEKMIQLLQPYMPRVDVPPPKKPQKWKLSADRMTRRKARKVRCRHQEG